MDKDLDLSKYIIGVDFAIGKDTTASVKVKRSPPIK